MSASTRTVLIVEDEPAIRGLVSLVLEGEGYSVDGASDGEEALTKVQERLPDVLIVDLDLPIMNGSDLVRACRVDLASRDLPIIAISGIVRDQAVRTLDIQGFLPKPFSLDTLLHVMQKALLDRDSLDVRQQPITPA